MTVWIVFREPGGIDSVWATQDDAQEYADDLDVRGINTMIEPYEVRCDITPPESGLTLLRYDGTESGGSMGS